MSETARHNAKGTPVRQPSAYRFADLTLHVGQHRLERDGKPIELGRLTYALLVALVESAPNVLTHDELVRTVWGGRSTTPETVTQRVKLLRDALGDDAQRPSYIGLVRGGGYRLSPPSSAWTSRALRCNGTEANPVRRRLTSLLATRLHRLTGQQRDAVGLR